MDKADLVTKLCLTVIAVAAIVAACIVTGGTVMAFLVLAGSAVGAIGGVAIPSVVSKLTSSGQ